MSICRVCKKVEPSSMALDLLFDQMIDRSAPVACASVAIALYTAGLCACKARAEYTEYKRLEELAAEIPVILRAEHDFKPTMSTMPAISNVDDDILDIGDLL